MAKAKAKNKSERLKIHGSLEGVLGIAMTKGAKARKPKKS